jgi:hypothetical protein
MIIGTNDTIGTVSSRPTSPLSQPHWKMATITPYAAAIERMFMIAAFSGARMDRNTIMSRMNDNPTTAPMNSGSRSWMRSPRSTNAAA